MENEWALTRKGVDESRFQTGRIGPYRLGTRVRTTALGEVTLALHDHLEPVVELELFDALSHTSLVGPDGRLMADLAQVVGLRHERIAPMIGAGIEGGVPYVVRPHVLGRTLAELVEGADAFDSEFAAAILFAVSDVTHHLSVQGPQAGACSMGGFDARDVFLGFDGSVRMVGLGLKLARCPDDDSISADFLSCLELARHLDAFSEAGLSTSIADATSAFDIARTLRRRHGSVCAEQAAIVGATLRGVFGEAIQEERAFFGLATLQ